MILIAFALAQAATAAAPDCAELAQSDPERAVEMASRWHAEGGGALARQCTGLAYVEQEKWGAAAIAFEQGAREAQAAKQAAAAGLWVQAGNARLADGDARAAIAAFDAALVTGALAGPAKGEARLDRARANFIAQDLTAARADLDEALKLVPEDPLAWLLSASLARRMDQLERAQVDIAEAASRSPDDASVALEAGRIALAAGAPGAARIAWEGALKAQPGSPAALAAKAELDRLAAPAQR